MNISLVLAFTDLRSFSVSLVWRYFSYAVESLLRRTQHRENIPFCPDFAVCWSIKLNLYKLTLT